jgi:serine/threonine protein kinase
MRGPPTVGGKYVLARLLGKGAMGAVYEAVEVETGVHTAVKVLRRPWQPDEAHGLVARFEREAHAIRTIVSEHVPRIMEAGIDPATGFHFIAMELFRGEGLDKVTKRMDGISATLAMKIAAQTCAGLAAAHATGVVHRDIKPQNLFLATRLGAVTVKILDFGVAKLRMEGLWDQFEDVTEMGQMPGSPRYMSPEQSRGEGVDHRADIWALGVVMYEVLAGTPPFGEFPSVAELVTAICTAQPVPIRQRIRWVPNDYERIVTRALQTDPQLRYQSAAEMLADLDAALPDGRAITAEMMISPADMPTSVIQINAPATARKQQPSLPSIFESTTTNHEILTDQQISELTNRHAEWVRKHGAPDAPSADEDFPTELMSLSDLPEEVLKNAAAEIFGTDPVAETKAEPSAVQDSDSSLEITVDVNDAEQPPQPVPVAAEPSRRDPTVRAQAMDAAEQNPQRSSVALAWAGAAVTAIGVGIACWWALQYFAR